MCARVVPLSVVVLSFPLNEKSAQARSQKKQGAGPHFVYITVTPKVLSLIKIIMVFEIQINKKKQNDLHACARM